MGKMGFIRLGLEGEQVRERLRWLILTATLIWAYATIFGSITTVSYALAYCEYLDCVFLHI